MRKITVTLNGIEEQPRRPASNGGAGLLLIGLGVVVLGLLKASSGPPPSPHHIPAALGVDPTELRFTEPGTRVIRLHNSGDEPLAIEQPAVNNQYFHVTSNCHAPLGKNESCLVSVAFLGNTAISKEQLRIVSNGGSATIALIAVITISPTPAPAALAADPTSLQFTEPVTQVVHLRNTGDELLTIKQPAANSASFRVTSDCTAPLARNESCVVSVAFNPNAGDGKDQLNIDSNGGSATIALTGSVPSVPAVELPALEFGKRLLGTPGKPLAVHYLNPTPTAVSLGPSSTTAPFNVWKDNCTKMQIGSGLGCDVFLTFDPVKAGPQKGELRIVTAGGNLAAHAALSGDAFVVQEPPPQLSLTPLDFGRQPVGKEGDARTLTLTNTTTSPVVIGPASTNPPFRIMRDDCLKTTLQPGMGCRVLAGFSPTVQGSQKGEVRIFTSTNGFVIARSSLIGIGILLDTTPAKVDIEPRAINFDGVAGTRPVVVSNRGGAPVSLGVNFETRTIGYSLDASACTNAPLPQGQQCKILVTANRFAVRSGESARLDISYAGHVEVVTLSTRVVIR